MQVPSTQKLIVRTWPTTQPYEETWHAMRSFTTNRNLETLDEVWFLEHPPVFTQGLAGKAEHILDAHNIPIVQTDRGGQVTYHGPGQLMGYLLFDLTRLKCNTRAFVNKIEQVIVDVLKELNISAVGNPQAPGVYVDQSKICSIGLRVSKGRSYHGFALNVDLNLQPFQYINPCGFKGLSVTKLSHWTSPPVTSKILIPRLIAYFKIHFEYDCIEIIHHSEEAQQVV